MDFLRAGWHNTNRMWYMVSSCSCTPKCSRWAVHTSISALFPAATVATNFQSLAWEGAEAVINLTSWLMDLWPDSSEYMLSFYASLLYFLCKLVSSLHLLCGCYSHFPIVRTKIEPWLTSAIAKSGEFVILSKS